jgi:hypothetical protein
MAARDSDDDIRKYLPDLKTILREADPARAKEKLEKAQDNPELDAALAHAQRPSARPSAASLWAAEPAGIAAVGPVVVTPEVVAPEPRRRKRAPFPAWQKAIAAVIAVVGPVVLLWVLLVRPSGQEREGARAGASAGSHVPAPTTSARASPIEPAPAPTAAADGGVSVAPLVPSVAGPTKAKGHPSTREDPYAAAPPRPAKTVDPLIPPPPPAPPAPTSSSWF